MFLEWGHPTALTLEPLVYTTMQTTLWSGPARPNMWCYRGLLPKGPDTALRVRRIRYRNEHTYQQLRPVISQMQSMVVPVHIYTATHECSSPAVQHDTQGQQPSRAITACGPCWARSTLEASLNV